MDHVHRSLCKNIRIAYDRFRYLFLQRLLNASDFHRGSVRSEAVHRRSCSHNHARNFGNSADHLTGVIDDTAADAQHNIRVMVKVQNCAAHRVFRRPEHTAVFLFQHMKRIGDSGFFQQPANGFSRCFVAVRAAQNHRVILPNDIQCFCNSTKRTRSDMNTGNCRSVHAPAGTGKSLRMNQFFQCL